MTKYLKKAERLPLGPLAKHGGYSVARKDEILRRYPEVLRYLKVVQRDIIRDVCPEGEEHLPAGKRVLIDRLMSKLATIRLVECYLGEHGIIRQDKVEERILDAEPIMSVWLSLDNGIRKDLALLGLERRALEVEPEDPRVILARFCEEEEAEKAARAAEEARSQASQGSGQGQAKEPAAGQRDVDDMTLEECEAELTRLEAELAEEEGRER